MPFTLTQVEDVMFLDKNTLIAHEYHYFQNDCKYYHLRQFEQYEENGKIYDQDDNEVCHLLGTDLYQNNRNNDQFEDA